MRSRSGLSEGALFTLTLLAMLLSAMSVQAEPIPGSSNTMVNGGFEAEWDSWEHGSGLDLTYDYSVEPWDRFVTCTSPMSDLMLRQIVDVSTNPLWNDNFHSMIVDLTVDIWIDNVAPGYAVTFWLDWWNEDKNSIDDPSLLGDPDGRSVGVTYTFTEIPGYVALTWLTVNPFNRDSTLFANFQPRWVSVEAELVQPGGYGIGIDKFILTSQCVPEPAALSLLVLGGLASLRRRR